MVDRANERRRFLINQQQAEADREKSAVPESFRCFLVERTEGIISAGVTERPLAELPAGEVLIRVAYSSVNFKDSMAAVGHRGIVKTFPHVPGVDAAGVVVESSSPDFQPGDEVIATGHEIGVERWGAWAEYVRVPAAWVLPCPEGLTSRETMILGTAGFTAAQCVAALVEHGITPDSGEVVVTGATGGVAIVALKILSQLEYRTVAVTGKAEQFEWLKSQGATRAMLRQEFIDESTRPLLTAAWAGGVDTVGGVTLTSLIRGLQHRGCVAACGVVGGAELPLTVYPFILRGVTLAGIDSAWCPEQRRNEIWRRLGAEWKPAGLEELVNEVSLDEVQATVDAMQAGKTVGRTIVRLQ